MATVERINRPLAEALRAFLIFYRQSDGSYILPDKLSGEELIRIANVALADELSFYPVVDDLVWDIARHEGFMIPATPVESRGDARDFLKEHGVRNSKEWYEKRGFSPRQLRSLFTTSAFMARNKHFWRKIIPLQKNDATNGNRLAPVLLDAIDFCLEDIDVTQDETLFRV